MPLALDLDLDLGDGLDLARRHHALGDIPSVTLASLLGSILRACARDYQNSTATIRTKTDSNAASTTNASLILRAAT